MFNIFSLSITVSLSNSSLKKKRTRSIFSSLFCCLRSYDAEPPATPNNNSSPLSPPVEENGASPKVRHLYTGSDYSALIQRPLLLCLTVMCGLLMLNRSHHNSLSLFFCAECITFVWIIVHLSCGSAPHFLSCLFPLSSSLMSQCDQVEVIPIPSVCMIPLHSVPSACALACRMEHRTTVHSNPLLKRLCGQWCTLLDGCLHALYIILLLRRLESLTFFHKMIG